MAQWYLSYNNQQYGPYDEVQARTHATANPNGFAWREGFANWLPIRQVPELTGAAAAPAAVAVPVAPAPVGPAPVATQRRADEIDYRIVGAEMQFVEVELDPGESAVAEAGAMMYKDATIQMETIFGDGSTSGAGAFMDKLISAGKRVLTGESLFMTVFTHTGQGKGHVAFAAPFPGNIVPMRLTELGGSLICQKDSLLAAARGVSIGIFFQRKILTGLFGGEGFIMQRLDGDGLVFVHAGGTLVERQLAPGEVLHVDTGCIVGFQPTVDFDLEQVGGIKSMLFGGEGVFFAVLRGPGKVWLQSLPFSRLAGRMLQAAPQRGGGGREEGSVLGPLGRILDGDNSF
ncbi:MAG: TIGR00266 family protein [Acidobacteriota bacterium]